MLGFVQKAGCPHAHCGHLHSDIAILLVRTVLPAQSIVVIGSRAACVGLAFPVRDGKSWNLFVTEESYSYA